MLERIIADNSLIYGHRVDNLSTRPEICRVQYGQGVDNMSTLDEQCTLVLAPVGWSVSWP